MTRKLGESLPRWPSHLGSLAGFPVAKLCSRREVLNLAEFAEAIVATSMHPTFAKAVLALTAILAATPCLHACTGPQALEARVRAHPATDTYTELGDWFGDRKQYTCAL